MREDPAFQPNHNFVRDMTNVLVGMIWQLCLVSLPIFIVLRNWPWVGGVAVALALASVFMKFNWYDKLEKVPLGAGERMTVLTSISTGQTMR